MLRREKMNTEEIKKLHDNLWEKELKNKELFNVKEYKPQTKFLVKHLPRTGSIMDMGCGIGNYVKFVKEKINKNVKGIELSDVPSKYDKDIISADYLNFKFEEQFDAIYSLSVLEQIPDNKQTLLKLNSDLKSGGLLLITVPTSKHNLFNLQRNIICFLTTGKTCKYHAYPVGEIKSMLEEAGFKVVEIKGYMTYLFFDFVLFLKVLNKFINLKNFIESTERFYYEKVDDLIPNWYKTTFGYHMAIVAEKRD